MTDQRVLTIIGSKRLKGGSILRGIRYLTAALVLLVSACGDDAADTAETSTTTTTEAILTTTEPPDATLPEIADGSAEIEATNVDYLVDDRIAVGSLAADVYWPTAEGPWPVVVMFHGNKGSPDDLRAEARAIAARGRVVFNAAWEGYAESVPEEFRNEVIACGIAYARATAADHGGDPAHLTVFGYSLGGGFAARVALSGDEPSSSCVAAAEGPIGALVLLDPEPLVFPESLDAQLADDLELFYRLTPWRDLDGGDDFPVHVLVTGIEGSEHGRSVADPAWLAIRHTDIDLAAAVDAGDDGFLSLQEMAAWAYEAFAAAGIDVSLTVLPDSAHSQGSWRPADREIIRDTVVRAEEL